jgi:hypothetical protein
LHGGGEVFENPAPVALVVGTAAMALVDDNEVEEWSRRTEMMKPKKEWGR